MIIKSILSALRWGGVFGLHFGGGGGDGGAAARQAAIEKQKAQSRQALNTQFGVGPATAPTQADFTTPQDVVTGHRSDNGTVTGGFDQAGFDAATKQYNDALANKTARDAMYADVRNNTYTAGKRGLDETADVARRQNGFSLFAQGLNGGSEDINQNALMDRTYNKGLLDLGAKADSAESGLKSSDESTRLGLLQSIDNGMDQGSAISSSINQMKNASDKATADAQGTSLGDLFAQSGALYTKSQAAQGMQAGMNQYPLMNRPYYNPVGITAPRASSAGMTSRTY